MKTLALIILATITTAAAWAQAPATPAPFDALHIAPQATPAPTLTAKQAQFKKQIVTATRMSFTQLLKGYSEIMALVTRDDSDKGGLTPKEKQAALSVEEKAELQASADDIKKIINRIKPGALP